MYLWWATTDLGVSVAQLTRVGRIEVQFIYYCRSNRIVDQFIIFHFIVLFTSKNNVSDICHLWEFISIDNIQVCSHKLPFATSVLFPLSLLSICYFMFIVDDSEVVNRRVYFSIVCGGRLGALFIHLFVFICWSYRMITLMLCYHSTAPSTCKDDISASAICHL